MQSATVREVQHNLASILKRVEHGEEIEIRRRRRPVARLVPIPPSPDGPVDWSGLNERLARMYGGRMVGGKTAGELVAEGRGER